MDKIINIELLDKMRIETINEIMAVAEKDLTETMTGKMYSVSGYDVIIVRASDNFLMAKVKGDEKKKEKGMEVKLQ